MFRGDHPELRDMVRRAQTLARDLGHTRIGSEHLLLALTGSTLGAHFADHGATGAAIRSAVALAAPAGAGAAVDRETLAPLGIDIDALLTGSGPLRIDQPPRREPLLPRGAAAARRRSGRMSPPLGLDAQAAYEASLRLALARRERDHRPEHLALTLVALDPGVAWILAAADVDREALLGTLSAAFPPSHRGPSRRIGRRARQRDIVRRYEHATGRTVIAASAVASLIDG